MDANLALAFLLATAINSVEMWQVNAGLKLVESAAEDAGNGNSRWLSDIDTDLQESKDTLDSIDGTINCVENHT